MPTVRFILLPKVLFRSADCLRECWRSKRSGQSSDRGHGKQWSHRRERDREPSPQKRGIGTYSKISRLIDCGQDCRRREPIYPGLHWPKMGVWSTFGFPPTSKVKRLTFLLRLVESASSPRSRKGHHQREDRDDRATQSVRISPVAVSSSNITIFSTPPPA